MSARCVCATRNSGLKWTLMSVVVPSKPWFISFSKVVETKKGTGCIYIYMIELLIAEFIYMP